MFIFVFISWYSFSDFRKFMGFWFESIQNGSFSHIFRLSPTMIFVSEGSLLIIYYCRSQCKLWIVLVAKEEFQSKMSDYMLSSIWNLDNSTSKTEAWITFCLNGYGWWLEWENCFWIEEFDYWLSLYLFLCKLQYYPNSCVSASCF